VYTSTPARPAVAPSGRRRAAALAWRHGAWALALSLISVRAIAGPADYVFVPTVEYGEREIDFKSGHSWGGQPQAAAWSAGFGYGAQRRWFTEFYLKYADRAGGPQRFDAYEWENKFQLTETGAYPIDLGFIVEIEDPANRAEGYEVTFGPLAQTDFGRIQANLNVLFQRNYRADFANPLLMSYQVQVKYRYRPEFEFGLQGFGNMGAWDHWSPNDLQSHRFGPAVFGKLQLAGRQAIRYNAAYLVGATRGAPDRGLRMQLEYEF
jgi:hypothetical protein